LALMARLRLIQFIPWNLAIENVSAKAAA
jgi:hypothetical protein